MRKGLCQCVFNYYCCQVWREDKASGDPVGMEEVEREDSYIHMEGVPAGQAGQ